MILPWATTEDNIILLAACAAVNSFLGATLHRLTLLAACAAVNQRPSWALPHVYLREFR